MDSSIHARLLKAIAVLPLFIPQTRHRRGFEGALCPWFFPERGNPWFFPLWTLLFPVSPTLGRPANISACFAAVFQGRNSGLAAQKNDNRGLSRQACPDHERTEAPSIDFTAAVRALSCGFCCFIDEPRANNSRRQCHEAYSKDGNDASKGLPQRRDRIDIAITDGCECRNGPPYRGNDIRKFFWLNCILSIIHHRCCNQNHYHYDKTRHDQLVFFVSQNAPHELERMAVSVEFKNPKKAKDPEHSHYSKIYLQNKWNIEREKGNEIDDGSKRKYVFYIRVPRIWILARRTPQPHRVFDREDDDRK